MSYVVIVSSSSDPFHFRKVFGPFETIEEIKDWIKDKYSDWAYMIDINPLIEPKGDLT